MTKFLTDRNLLLVFFKLNKNVKIKINKSSSNLGQNNMAINFKQIMFINKLFVIVSSMFYTVRFVN